MDELCKCGHEAKRHLQYGKGICRKCNCRIFTPAEPEQAAREFFDRKCEMNGIIPSRDSLRTDVVILWMNQFAAQRTAELEKRVGELEAKLAKANYDFLGEALNSGDGTYKP